VFVCGCVWCSRHTQELREELKVREAAQEAVDSLLALHRREVNNKVCGRGVNIKLCESGGGGCGGRESSSVLGLF